MQRFVIVVDTQADFMLPEGALPVAGADRLIGAMDAWLAKLSPHDTAGILFTFDTHRTELYPASPEAEEFPIHCVQRTPGWENVLDIAAIAPGIPVYRLEKGVFDMWVEPDLVIVADANGETIARDAFFARLRASGVASVTVIGVAADYCVRWAIDGLLARGFAVDVPVALTRGIARSIEQVVESDFTGTPVRLEAAA
ncbi:nicotinamidase/pyrazinamidase [Sphingomonas naasensis]|uniref:nicotinamidase n=1 Tax=Sphingomonas naasensis TaxID=1344951 RepID=A0A4S1WU35_9SPHN|nr:isochorismatase family protein [Sphingomonas naasensis]NIJ18425.1 nicotinamidase/pyrazinamidase [Sphingomonas naasensis]TGX45690.1 isochorismatase family protein [Sphingomonas naasensis]